MKLDQKILKHLDDCIAEAKKRHSEAEIIAAAIYLNRKNILSEPHTLSLFAKGGK